MGEFIAQDLANTVWAFTEADQSDELLFAVLARAAERRLREFNVQNLANMAWAFAKAGWADAPLLSTIVIESAKNLSWFRQGAFA